MDTLTPNQSLNVLHFLLENTHLCIQLDSLDKILPLVSLEPVPGSPAYVAGLMNLAGKTLPVVDLAICLGMKRTTPYTVDAPILLCSYKTHQAGFVVDKILTMEQVDPACIQMHESFNKPDAYFCGAIAVNENMSLLIDISRILPIEIKEEPKKNINNEFPVQLKEN
jgi:purine-binding chemotaxis protein CheW